MRHDFPVLIVGGGLAGLAASVELARGGRDVTLFEQAPHVGGRAACSISTAAGRRWWTVCG